MKEDKKITSIGKFIQYVSWCLYWSCSLGVNSYYIANTELTLKKPGYTTELQGFKFMHMTHQSPLASPNKPFDEAYLSVCSLHKIWYAQYGNPDGIPVIILHGGPGAGCSDTDIKFFDLSFWRVILLDQRGARRSKPFSEMKENTTLNLISDLEHLRSKLKIDKWLLFGGSWGSTLALSYGETYPNHILGFILEVSFLQGKVTINTFGREYKIYFQKPGKNLRISYPKRNTIRF